MFSVKNYTASASYIKTTFLFFLELVGNQFPELRVAEDNIIIELGVVYLPSSEWVRVVPRPVYVGVVYFG